LQEFVCARDAAAGGLEGLDDDCADGCGEEGLGGGDVVVGRDDDVVGQV